MKKIILSISLGLAAVNAFATLQTQDDEDKPPQVYLYGDEANMQDNSDTYQVYYLQYPNGTTQADFSVEDMPWSSSDHFWVYGLGGAGSVNNGDTEDSWDSYGDEVVDDDAEFNWPYTLDWTGFGGGSATYYSYGAVTGTSYNYADILTVIGNEHCDVKQSYPSPANWNESAGVLYLLDQGHAKEAYQRTAQTAYHVQTGGKAIPRQNLWEFTGSVSLILDPRATPPFSTTLTQDVSDKTQITLGAVGKLKADGNLWLTLPDGIDEDVTPSISGPNFYIFNVTGSKYLSQLQVFVRQPWPNFEDGGDVFPDGPPIGYPVYNIITKQAGHAWWELTSDAPIDAVNQFTTPNCSQWLNQQVGYSYITASFVSYLPPIKQGPGTIDTANGAEYDVEGKYEIGFQGSGVIDALNYTESISNSPGIWNSATHNCVHEVVKTASAAGVQIPLDDATPESLGFDLPPNTSE